MTKGDLSTCHRLVAPSTAGKARPIIARFTRRDAKTAVMKKKKELRKRDDLKDVFIADDLTRLRSRLVQAMKQDVNIVRVWTIDGKVHYIMKRGGREEKKALDSIDDLVHLGWDEGKIREAGLFLEL